MPLHPKVKGRLNKGVTKLFDKLTSSEDLLVIYEVGDYDPATDGKAIGPKHKVRGLIKAIPLDEIDGELLQTGDAVAIVDAQQLNVRPTIGMIVEQCRTLPEYAVSEGAKFYVHSLKTDPSNSVHTLFLRRR